MTNQIKNSATTVPESIDCLICYSPFNKLPLWICSNCNIKYHHNCISLWTRQKIPSSRLCPTCRHIIPPIKSSHIRPATASHQYSTTGTPNPSLINCIKLRHLQSTISYWFSSYCTYLFIIVSLTIVFNSSIYSKRLSYLIMNRSISSNLNQTNYLYNLFHSFAIQYHYAYSIIYLIIYSIQSGARTGATVLPPPHHHQNINHQNHHYLNLNHNNNPFFQNNGHYTDYRTVLSSFD